MTTETEATPQRKIAVLTIEVFADELPSAPSTGKRMKNEEATVLNKERSEINQAQKREWIAGRETILDAVRAAVPGARITVNDIWHPRQKGV